MSERDPSSASEPADGRRRDRRDGRVKLLDAALRVIRERGYSATTVDDLCRAAGVTKGAFFHHFASKEDLAVAAAAHFSAMADGLFASAPYRSAADPLDRVLGYVAFRRAMIGGALPDYTCLLGTMVQEAYETHPAIREAARRGIEDHAATLVADIRAAMEQSGRPPVSTPESLALHTQAVLQGSFILAKARHDGAPAVDSIDHLTRYLRMVLGPVADHTTKEEESP
jgi:TetR/AcrR family transcriptional repressor of nem operon